MTPEEKAREIIDSNLQGSGWRIQDYTDRNISLPGVAVREFPTKGRREPVDYALFIEGEMVGIIEAKSAGTMLTPVEQQSGGYADNLFEGSHRPVFIYESTGDQTRFCDRRDPDYRSRNVMTFHQPHWLFTMYRQSATLRSRLRNNMPPELPHALRKCQDSAIRGLEESLKANRSRALIHMAMGSGKTIMMVAESYRLLKFAGANRILFLVDRKSLGDQAQLAYETHMVENSKFTDLYNVQHLTSHSINSESAVVISTVQRLYSILTGSDVEIDDESSEFEKDDDDVVREVRYNDSIPIDTFDFIVVDEAHRSIYNKWRQVLEYFDAFIIGMTATPQQHTHAFFNGNVVSEYTMQDSVADGINVDYGGYSILTEMNTGGVHIRTGDEVMLLDRDTGEMRRHTAGDDKYYTPADLDRKIEAESNIRVIIKAFRKIQEDHFGRPRHVPKTLIFAKTIRHAEAITKVVRDEYGKGNEFCRTITSTMANPKDARRSFMTDVGFRIAVSVDMLATGFDMPSLECLLFMRLVKSAPYALQMVGRGCRTIGVDKLQEVTPDALFKDDYLVVDATGALDAVRSGTVSRPPTGKNYRNLEKIMDKVADGRASDMDLEVLANRIDRLAGRMGDPDKEAIQNACGMRVEKLVMMMRENLDRGNRMQKATERFGEKPTEEQKDMVAEEARRAVSEPFFKPDLRDAIRDAAKQDDLVITTKIDELIGTMVIKMDDRCEKFREFVNENRERFVALQIIYNTPYRLQGLMFDHLKELEKALVLPPYNLTPEKVWAAYEKMNKSMVKRNDRVMLTDLISLIRFVTDTQDEMLVSHRELVMEKFEKWLETQKASGANLTVEQEGWLRNIAESISVSCTIDKEDIRREFHDMGGLGKFYELFPDGDQMLVQMHKELTNFE